MTRTSLTNPVVSACMGLLACSSCVERNEVITVAADGSVTIELQYEGTEEELSQGDAMPSAGSGWDVVRSVRKESDEVKHVLTSKRRFEPREKLPRTFAAKGDPEANLYLDFPTTVRTERRGDGLYFFFRRAYTPRRWGYIEYWKDFIFDDQVKKLSDKPVEELTSDERLQIVYAFATFEALKQLEFAKTASGESNLRLPVEHRLAARRKLLDFYDSQSDYYERLIDSCGQFVEDEQDECFGEAAERLLAEGYEAFIRSLRHSAAMGEVEIAKFKRAYEQARRRYEITDALGGHAFEIEVRMPGSIVAHNALDSDVGVEDGMSTVRFQFDGKAFRDRTHELIVVSRVGE